MTGSLKAAFDSICAEDSLKSNTLLFLQKEMQRQSGPGSRTFFKRYAVAFASVLVILLSGMFAYDLYFTPSAYVDVDVNPSVGLVLNRFDRVIGAHAYNEDGEIVLTGLSLQSKRYEDAIIVLISAIGQKGYNLDEGFVSVTLQTDSTSREEELLAMIEADIRDYMTGHHHTAQIDVFTVGGDTRGCALELNMSPAKYLAIQELMEVDSTATVEGCRNHSIGELRQFAWEHGNHHGNGDNGDSGGAPEHDGGNYSEEEGRGQEDGPNQDPVQSNGHHGENTGNGHHGGRE